MTVPSASQSAARLSPVHEGSAAPPVITLDAPMADPAGWTDEHRAEVLALVTEQGSVRIRGLGLADPGQVGAVLGELSSALVGDEEAFAQRRRYAPGIYSSAAWPDHERMCMHHELSYRLSVPTLLVLGCLTAPSSGGETGLADAAAVLADLPADLVEKFATEGWLLLRTYGGDIGPSLADAFGTEDRGSIEAYCRVNAIDYHWRPDGGLSTRQRRPAVVTHPVTGRRCWFNQVAFFSEWTIEEEIREFLVDMYGADGLPFTTAFGNGDAIEADMIATLNEVYDAHTVREPWQAGDLLLLDNIGTAHSREAFEGDREIVVAMADPVTPEPGIQDGRAVTTLQPPARVPSFSVISGGQVQQVLTGRQREVVAIVEDAYRLHGAGDSLNPPSYFLRFPDRPNSRIIALPAEIGGPGRTAGLKWISSFPDNVRSGVPRASAVLILNDPDTGYPYACLESSIISATRTAASAALAADWLTRDRDRPRRVGFFGTGLIARYIHSFLLGTGWTFDEIGLHDLSPESTAGFSDYLHRSPGQQATVEVHDRAEDLIRRSDLVVFATIAGAPHVSEPDWFDHHPVVLHVSLRDLAPEVLLTARNVVDDVEHCLKADTSPHLVEQATGSRDFLDGTLPDVIDGRLRLPADETVIFSPFGLGVLDLAVGRYVHSALSATGHLHVIDDFFHEQRRYG